MSWVMSSMQEKAPLRHNFFIGAIKVAEMQYIGAGSWRMHTMNHSQNFPSLKEAMTEMHKMLNSPPKEEDND